MSVGKDFGTREKLMTSQLRNASCLRQHLPCSSETGVRLILNWVWVKYVTVYSGFYTQWRQLIPLTFFFTFILGLVGCANEMTQKQGQAQPGLLQYTTWFWHGSRSPGDTLLETSLSQVWLNELDKDTFIRVQQFKESMWSQNNSSWELLCQILCWVQRAKSWMFFALVRSQPG